MGHHLDADGRFQSDKYSELPPDVVLISDKDPAAQNALARLREDCDVSELRDPKYPGKLLVPFHDRAAWPALEELGEDYLEIDRGFGNDVLSRLSRIRLEEA